MAEPGCRIPNPWGQPWGDELWQDEFFRLTGIRHVYDFGELREWDG